MTAFPLLDDGVCIFRFRACIFSRDDQKCSSMVLAEKKCTRPSDAKEGGPSGRPERRRRRRLLRWPASSSWHRALFRKSHKRILTCGEIAVAAHAIPHFAGIACGNQVSCGSTYSVHPERSAQTQRAPPEEPCSDKRLIAMPAGLSISRSPSTTLHRPRSTLPC